MLQQLFTQSHLFNKPAMVGSSNIAQKGSTPFAMITNQISADWIVDSGASDHMSGNLNLFHSYRPCHTPLSIRIADGTCSRVVGLGSIRISKLLTLHSVLFVPNLAVT